MAAITAAQPLVQVPAIQSGDPGRLSVAEIKRPDNLPELWQELYEERAAIRGFDGGQVRGHAEAEAEALKETIAMMRNPGCLLENQ
jgi:hypothetical protein